MKKKKKEEEEDVVALVRCYHEKPHNEHGGGVLCVITALWALHVDNNVVEVIHTHWSKWFHYFKRDLIIRPRSWKDVNNVLENVICEAMVSSWIMYIINISFN